MTSILATLSAVKRPRLLIRAARFGLVDYNRDRDLKRLFRSTLTPSPVQAIERLLSEEAEIEEIRRAGDASYSVARHVELLIALMGEARLMPSEG